MLSLKLSLVLEFVCTLTILSGCVQSTLGWHWERIETGLPSQVVILDLVVDPANPNRIWAGYYAPDGLATSHDGGRTWITGTRGLDDNPVFDLLLLSDDLLWAATRHGLMKSIDGGASWKPIAGEGLPSAAGFALATDEARRVYAGFDGVGAYMWRPEQDTWNPLTHNEPLNSAAVLSLAVSRDGKQIYAGTAREGLFASQDAGHIWTAAFPGDYVPNLALDPSHPETAIASLRDRLVRTRDGGKSWEILNVPWASDEVVSLLWQTSQEKTAPHVGPRGALWAGTGKGQVFCSQDAGDSWAKMGDHASTQGGVLALALADRRLLAGTWTGIYASPTSGECSIASQDWTYLSPSLGIPNANVLIAADTGLLVGTRVGLFRWQAEGRRWAKVSMGHSPNQDSPPGGVTALAVAPSDQQLVYAGAAYGGLYRSNDSGASWTRVPSELDIGVRELAIAPEDANHVYMLAAWERMYESSNGGSSWQARWTGLSVTNEAISLAIDPVNPSTIYIGTDSGLYRSHYRGKAWKPVGHRLDGQTVLNLVARPEQNAEGEFSALYVGSTRGAYRSYDGGDTVEPWGKGLEEISVTTFLFDPNNSKTVCAGTAYAGLFYSKNGGETWQSIGPPELADEVIEALAWGPEGELFVASAGGVWEGSKD